MFRLVNSTQNVIQFDFINLRVCINHKSFSSSSSFRRLTPLDPEAVPRNFWGSAWISNVLILLFSSYTLLIISARALFRDRNRSIDDRHQFNNYRNSIRLFSPCTVLICSQDNNFGWYCQNNLSSHSHLKFIHRAISQLYTHNSVKSQWALVSFGLPVLNFLLQVSCCVSLVLHNMSYVSCCGWWFCGCRFDHFIFGTYHWCYKFSRALH